MQARTPDHRTITHAHLFCGVGGGARGFNQATARVGILEADFRCLGGIDVDAAAIRDFSRLAGVPGTCLDLFDQGQYTAFHGHEPPPDWREVGPDEVRRAFGGERPHILFLSAPCKGFSGLLSESKSKLAKYQALNRLTLRGIWLALEAYRDDPVELILFENVPRIATRGRSLLDRIANLLRAFGYAVAETTHDCGVLGGLTQSRKRFLLVARHIERVPPFLYEPPRRSVRGVGDVLGRMPSPGHPGSGPMHRMPNLSWKTWVRLAFVEAGSDWRSLNKLRVQDGILRDFAIAPTAAWQADASSVADPRAAEAMFQNGFCTIRWHTPGNGAGCVADPRMDGQRHGPLGVHAWDDTARTVAGESFPTNGPFSVADPRHHGPAKHCNEFRIVPWEGQARAVTSAHGTGGCVADPRQPCTKRNGQPWAGGGQYGVVPWEGTAGAVTGSAGPDSGRWNVADPRAGLPPPDARLLCRIRALDGTWHRPFTTLELAALQSLVDPEEALELDGLSDAAWRERIGNAVPPGAAQAIAETMGRTLLMAWSSTGFMLSNLPIWVQPIAVALSVSQPDGMSGASR
jgi:site-specific DNA-cytosine methylase